MANRIYDFKCSSGHITERFIDSETQTIECPECDQDAKRVISKCFFVLDAVSGDYPGATMKWAREHSKAAKR
jgi:Zn finger protein HypA/HybF involved in hydrogenase expression